MTKFQRILRWGRSSYETDAALARERDLAEALGLSWTHTVERPTDHALGATDALVVTSGVSVDAEVLKHLGGRCVLTTTSGYDHIDLRAAGELDVRVARCPLARRDAVVEWTVGHLAVLLRRSPRQWSASREGRWSRPKLPDMNVRPVSGSTVVVVGCGVIGSRVLTVLTALGATVRVVDPGAQCAGHANWSLEEAIEGADAVTLHCSLNDSSRYLIGPDALARLPSHAVVVNSSRGAALDLACAVDRVVSGTLGGLAVDVFETEPRVGAELAEVHPQILYTPHAAGYTFDLGQRVATEVADTLGAWSRGEGALHPVTQRAKIP